MARIFVQEASRFLNVVIRGLSDLGAIFPAPCRLSEYLKMIQERTKKQRSAYDEALAEILEEALGDDLIDYLSKGATADVIQTGVSMVKDGEIVLRWKWDPASGRHKPMWEFAW